MATVTSPTYVDHLCDLVRCAICNKPVDRIMREESFERDTIRFKVWCHGNTDNCEITHQDFMEMIGKLEPGYAFTTDRIERNATVPSVDHGALQDYRRALPRAVQLPDRISRVQMERKDEVLPAVQLLLPEDKGR